MTTVNTVTRYFPQGVQVPERYSDELVQYFQKGIMLDMQIHQDKVFGRLVSRYIELVKSGKYMFEEGFVIMTQLGFVMSMEGIKEVFGLGKEADQAVSQIISPQKQRMGSQPGLSPALMKICKVTAKSNERLIGILLTTIPTKCEACGRESTNRCSRCHRLFFCDQACLKNIWKTHKITCKFEHTVA
jgi:hypothetical protein